VRDPLSLVQQIILLAGCSSAAPVSSFDLHMKIKKLGHALVFLLEKYNFM
jgi:hypothetical protein